MRRAIFVISLLCGMGPAFAQQQTIEQKATVCATCHGDKGIPVDHAYPVIWGQQQGYLYFQLRDFKSGSRKNDLMSAVAATLDRTDLMPLAAYFAAKPWPALRQPTPSDADAAVAQRDNTSIGCTGCHLGQYQGAQTVPRLAGQNHDYLLKTMRDFRSGARGNNPGMTDLMKATKEADFPAIANYLAGQ
jgi:cytochrome c553